MKSICFFNNKGGVGKTTLACNVAASMSQHFKLSVLLVDADPQCNASQLILPPKLLGDLYGPRRPPSAKAISTLFDLLAPIAKGEPDVMSGFRPFRANKNRFGVDLVPGHPRVALLEDRLSQAWVDLSAGDIGGARRTNWALSTVNQVAEDYDVIIFDIGPSLGALNRSVLVGSDSFVTPMGCDIFSIMGVSNIAEWLKNWKRSYGRGIETCREQWGDDIDEYEIRDLEEYPVWFSGYTVQQYVSKTIRGERRPTKAYEKIIKRFPDVIRRDLGAYIDPEMDDEALKLGNVPNMYSLVPLAQDANVPIHGIQSKDGLVGAHYSQQETYTGFIRNVTMAIMDNAEIESVL